MSTTVLGKACRRALPAVLLVCAGAMLAPLSAQAPVAPGDRVRVLTQTATVVGRVTTITDDSLVLAHRDRRFASPMTIDWRMIQRLRVSQGRQNRTMPTLIGVAAGALVGGVCMLGSNNRMSGVDQNGPWSSNSSWLRPYCYAMPVAGGLVGFVTGGEKWREAELPAQKAAALPEAQPQR